MWCGCLHHAATPATQMISSYPPHLASQYSSDSPTLVVAEGNPPALILCKKSLSSCHSAVVKPVSNACIQPSQVTTVTSVNTPVFSSLKGSRSFLLTTEELDVTPTSLSVNNAANLVKSTNIFKEVDCNPPAYNNPHASPWR